MAGADAEQSVTDESNLFRTTMESERIANYIKSFGFISRVLRIGGREQMADDIDELHKFFTEELQARGEADLIPSAGPQPQDGNNRYLHPR